MQHSTDTLIGLACHPYGPGPHSCFSIKSRSRTTQLTDMPSKPLAGLVVAVSTFDADVQELNYDELKAKAIAAGASVSGILHKKVTALICTV